MQDSQYARFHVAQDYENKMAQNEKKYASCDILNKELQNIKSLS